MIKFLYILLISLALYSCSSEDKYDTHNISHSQQVPKVNTVFADTNTVIFQKYISNPCDTFSVEFDLLYPILDSLSNAFTDSLIIDNYLKDLGFTATSSSQGNWEQGPRVIVLELIKDNCKCKVFKKYYYHDTLPSGKYNLRVTEKLVCNADNNAVE